MKTYKFEKVNILYILGSFVSTIFLIIFNYGISYFLDEIIVGNSERLVLVWMVFMIIVVCISGVLTTFLAKYFPLRLQLKKSLDISNDIIKAILKSSQSVYQQKEKGFYINLVTTSAFTYGDIYGQFYIDLVANILYAFTIIILVSFINIYFGILFILYIPLCWLLTQNPSKKIATFQKKGLITQDKFMSETKKVVESKREINIAKADKFFENHHRESSDNYLAFIKKYRLFEIISQYLPSILSDFYKVVILTFSAYLTLQNQLTIGTLFLLYQFMNYFYAPVSRIFEIIIHKNINQSHIERVESFFKNSKVQSGFDNIYIDSCDFVIKTSNFNLYSNFTKDKLLFKSDNIIIPDKSFVIVKGQNGSGKSMFMNYITGFLDINNSNQQIKVSSSFLDVAYLTYPLIVVEGTLKDNMFGTEIDSKIKDMLKIDFEEKIIKDNPINLSFGQQQKLNLLRVLSSKKSNIILDEPLTNLDYYIQQNLIEYLKTLKGKVTIFIIMHSNELDEEADYILDIKDGYLRQLQQSD